MNKTKKVSRKIIALVLSIVMILSIVPMSASAAEAIKKGLTTDKEVNFAVMSDMHYYPASLAGNYNEAFMESTKTALAREPYQSVGILESALAGIAEHAKKNGMKYLILSGDLTSNGEYEAH